MKEVVDLKETLNIIRRAKMWLRAIVMGKACSSVAAASSGWCVLNGVVYFFTIAATGIFALYLIGLLSTIYRS